MSHLSRSDYASALRVLAQVEAQAGDPVSFARATEKALNDYVGAELTSFSICDLVSGEASCLDRHFFEPPLAGPHVVDGEQPAGDHLRHIEQEHVIAVPLFKSQKTLVSVVLKRRGLAFDERDRERLDLLRPHLAFLYQHASKARSAEISMGMPPLPRRADVDLTAMAVADPSGLTPREGEVMHWLSCGKTDAEIAALLSISPRTVQKHLEHVYVKLGVETRTAAVMRAIALNGHLASAQRPYTLRGNGSSPAARH